MGRAMFDLKNFAVTWYPYPQPIIQTRDLLSKQGKSVEKFRRNLLFKHESSILETAGRRALKSF